MPYRRVSIVLLVAWLPAGVLGWGVHRWLDGGTGDPGPFLVGLAVAVGLGAAAHRGVTAAGSDPVVASAVGVGVGFALANATGYSVGVEVGGPAFGLALGLGLAAAAGAPGARVVLLGGSVLAVMIGVRLLLDPLGPPLPGAAPAGAPWAPVLLVAPALAGLGVLAACRGLLPGVTTTIGLTAAFGVAFVGWWMVTAVLVAPWSFALSVGMEIVGAVAVGAVALGLLTRPGEPVATVAARWAAAATAAVLLGVAVAVALRTLLGDTGAGVLVHLDLGASTGLAIASATAALPTLRRVAAAGTRVGA
jgi:hypothetical protein